MRASCGHTVTRYEVVETRRFSFEVHEICDSDSKTEDGIKYRHDPRQFVTRFWRQERAIECAQGMASGTWTKYGPIRAEYVPVDQEVEL